MNSYVDKDASLQVFAGAGEDVPWMKSSCAHAHLSRSVCDCSSQYVNSTRPKIAAAACSIDGCVSLQKPRMVARQPGTMAHATLCNAEVGQGAVILHENVDDLDMCSPEIAMHPVCLIFSAIRVGG